MSEIKISQSNQDEIGRWKNLEKYPMWRRVVNTLQRKIEDADKIINTIGADGDKTFTHRDIAIIKKNAYLDLIELPDIMVKSLAATGEKPIEQMDPYQSETDNEEVNVPDNVADFLGIHSSDFEDDL